MSCAKCGSNEHATSDCPHGIFSSKCAKCGSVDHSTSDCPHGIFSTQCSKCGSTEHSSSDCPHGIFSTKCAKCGSIEHSTSDCPHGIFSSSCSKCGSKNHSTADCPQGLFGKSTPSTAENGCLKIVVYIALIIGAIAVAIWLAVNIVLPVTLLNSALIFTILALVFKQQKVLFAILALLGGGYMMLDILNGWFSLSFVENVVKDSTWISVFVYINAVAIGLSTWLLMQPIWLKTNKLKVENKKINILYKALIILIVTVSTSVAQVIYHTVKNPFIRKTTIFINNSTPSIQKNALTDIDGNVYQTVIIGTQTWMVENLQTTKYNDGTSIPNVTDGTTWTNLSTPGYCFYNNDAANKNTYGALYNWHTVNTGKLAPRGWHIPTDAEWTTLENYLIANGYNYDGTTTGNKITKSLAANTLWNTNTTVGTIGNDLTNNNTSGFAGLPGGCRYYDGTFSGVGDDGFWWSSTEYSAYYAWYRDLGGHNSNVYSYYYNKRYGFSVRCVKD